MKYLLKYILIFLGFAFLVHLVLWKVNSPLYGTLQKQTQESLDWRRPSILEIRMSLEEEQRKELEAYKWTDRRKKHVQIPLERAFDYYLRTLP